MAEDDELGSTLEVADFEAGGGGIEGFEIGLE